MALVWGLLSGLLCQPTALAAFNLKVTAMTCSIHSKTETKSMSIHHVPTNLQSLKGADQCATCGKKLQDVEFDIGCEYERMHFFEPTEIVEVEVLASKSIANFCSKKCLSEGRQDALSSQFVPLPRSRPAIGPIEACAICHSAVDMTDWHLTYMECDISGTNHSSLEIDAIDLAVICRNCAPFNFARRKCEYSLTP